MTFCWGMAGQHMVCLLEFFWPSVSTPRSSHSVRLRLILTAGMWTGQKQSRIEWFEGLYGYPSSLNLSEHPTACPLFQKPSLDTEFGPCVKQVGSISNCVGAWAHPRHWRKPASGSNRLLLWLLERARIWLWQLTVQQVAMPALSGECLKETGPNGWRKPAVKEDGSVSNSSSTTTGCEPSVCEESEATKVARDGSGSSSGSRTETVKAYKESTQDESSSSASRSEQAQDVQDGDPPKQLNSLKTAGPMESVGSVGHPNNCKASIIISSQGVSMTARQSSYLPPSAASQTMGAARVAGAATALRLLECNPDSLLSRPLGGRVSAAKLARMQYQERLEAKAGDGHGDLLDFEDGSAGSEPATSSQAPAPSRSETLPGFVPETLWAGDTVLARYGPNGRFFRARVVRIYSSRGSSLADVEWLRTQDSRSGDEFLGPLQDELLNRNGLQVGTEVRALAASSGSDFAPEREQDVLRATGSQANAVLGCKARSSAAAVVPGPTATAPAKEAPPAAAMPDLLDFSPLGEAAPSGADLLAPAGDPSPGLPRLDFSGARPVEAQRPPLLSGGYGNVPVQAPTTRSSQKPQESFDFVSDLFLQVSDAQPPPCAFYCFSLCGCRMDRDCAYCHLFHQSRLKQRREAIWSMYVDGVRCYYETLLPSCELTLSLPAMALPSEQRQGYPSPVARRADGDVSSSPAQRQTFAVSPRPASGSSSGRKAGSSSAPSARSSTPIVAEDDSETRQVSTAASTNEATEAWAEPRVAAAAPPPPGGAAPTRQWQEAMDSLQREYAEALKSIDFRVNQRMTSLRSQLECSMQHELPPSYPPSDVSRGETDAEMVETDPELISP
eukprot:s1163_g17.t1